MSRSNEAGAANTVDWDRVRKWIDRDGIKINWKVFGAPTIMATDRSAFSGAVSMPRWDAPPRLILSAAINGAFFTRRENPHQAITPDEIIRSAEECIAAGAQIVHVHVRDERGYNVLDTGLFKETLSHLRQKHQNVALDACLVAVNAAEELQMVEMMKSGLMDAVPVNATAIILGDNHFVKSPAAMIEKTKMALDHGLRPQIAVYTDADVDNARRYLIDSGLLAPPYAWLVLPGLPGCSPMYSSEMMVDGFMRMVRLIRHVDASSTIIACTGGRTSIHLATLAILLGCHTRIGMEDTVWKWPHRDDLIESNAEIFAMVRDMALNLGRELMPAEEYRAFMSAR